MTYDHVQRSPLYFLLLALAAGSASGAIGISELSVRIILGVMALLVLILAFSFAQLRVHDEGQRLGVRFGPLPIFGWTIPYAEMRSVTPARSTLIDGWGMHWLPGRGWTLNLWGFDCVMIETDRGRYRVGTDEPRKLAEFLERRRADSESKQAHSAPKPA